MNTEFLWEDEEKLSIGTHVQIYLLKFPYSVQYFTLRNLRPKKWDFPIWKWAIWDLKICWMSLFLWVPWKPAWLFKEIKLFWFSTHTLTYISISNIWHKTRKKSRRPKKRSQPQNKDNLKNEDNLKMKTTLEMKRT